MDEAVNCEGVMEPQTIWRIRFETPHFTLETFDETEADARQGLRRAWLEHCKQTGAAENYLEDCADDIQAQEITLGVTYRDREQLFPPVSSKAS
jgi:hypothetical protein